MLKALRALGILNAAVWFGSAIFFTFIVGPAVFSPEVASFLPRPHAGRLALVVIDRLFILHYVCASIAFLHLTAEWLLSGKPFPLARLTLILLLVSLALIGGLSLQPDMRACHARAYNQQTPPLEAEAAMKSFRKLHALSQTANLFALAGLLVHLLLIPASHPFSSLPRGIPRPNTTRT